MLHNSHTLERSPIVGRSLQELRREAGYRSAREFAEACEITQSSMTRYEKEPDNIPVRSAWRIADVLGCSIDDVVGRESPLAADLRGDVQKRYDALPAPLRGSLDDYLGYLEGKANEVEDYRQELEDSYMEMFKLYLVMSMEGMSENDRCDLVNHGSSEAMRERFQDYVCDKVLGRSSTIMEGGEMMKGLMRAYDRFYSEK